MLHVIGAIVEDLNSKEALSELTLGVRRIPLGNLRNDEQVLVKDTVTVDHAFEDVGWLLDQFLQLDPLLSLHVVQELLLIVV